MTQNTPQKTSFEHFEWIDFCQPSRESLDKIAEEYQLDYFQIVDSLEYGHLPKYEKQTNYNFLILRAFTANLKQGETTIKELSNKIAFFYNDDKLITIHRSDFEFLNQIDQSYKNPESLLLFIIREMLETYQTPLNELDEKINEIEQIIFLKDYAKVSLEDMYFLKAQTRITKKLLQIFQNVINQLEVIKSNKSAVQDVKDRLLRLILSYEEVLENANNLLNTYLSVNAKKSNDVMKLLTIFSAFFLPLTFIAGIYGMNFNNMPELRWETGYFVILAVMLFIAIVIFWWFKRKRIL
jgi:magnesium transporter